MVTNFKVLGAIIALATAADLVAAVTFNIPSQVGEGGLTYAPLDSSPVGFSFEFFTFPSYMLNVTATMPCLEHFQDLTGTWPHIRIGGTTQDRALYDPNTDAYVVYSVSDPADAPMSLTFGPAFIDLASTYPGTVILGLNRGKNEIDNTIQAAQHAVTIMTENLHAIELGNEPEYYDRVPQPITLLQSSWNPSVDNALQNNWDITVGEAIGRTEIIQAGNSLPWDWNSAQLIASGNETVYEYVKQYSRHNYPGGNVDGLMSHQNIVDNVHGFDDDMEAANAIGKSLTLGETNSVSGGGAANTSPLFGAALWTMDYSVRLAASNIPTVYFHQGTVGNCQYCWWGRYSMGAPYYGAYAATAFLAHGSQIAALDTGSDNYAGYVTFDAEGKPLKALVYNSDYYGGGTRGEHVFTLSGVELETVTGKRLTAPTADSRQDRGDIPTFGGQSFVDGTCEKAGNESFEVMEVDGGSVDIRVGASEAVVVYFQ